jgi:hypothetical protein
MITEEGLCTYADCLSKVPWILGVLKWVRPDEHHIQRHTAGPNICYLNKENRFIMAELEANHVTYQNHGKIDIHELG